MSEAVHLLKQILGELQQRNQQAAQVSTTVPGSASPGRPISPHGPPKPPDKYQAAERLVSAGGAFVPGLSQLAGMMRSARELVDAWENIRAAFKPAPPPATKADLKSPAEQTTPRGPSRPSATPGTLATSPPARATSPPVRATAPITPGRGAPALPVSPPPVSPRPSIGATGALPVQTSAPPATGALPVQTSAPPATGTLPVQTSAPPARPTAPNWSQWPILPLQRAAGMGGTPPPRAIESVPRPTSAGAIPPPASTLRPQGTLPLTGAGDADRPASSGQSVLAEKLDKIIEKLDEVKESLAEEDASETGGAPTSDEREKGGRQSMWEHGETAKASASATPTHKPAPFPGRPEKKPEGSGLLKIIENVLPFL